VAKQDSEQKKTVERVMHEWKHGELENSRGGKVRNRRQAVAIALSESGASNQQSPRQNRRQYACTKSKERHAETAQQQKEGRRSMNRTGAPNSGGDAPTRAQLYREAARRNIPGRSSMNKAQLQRALRQ
jgi:Family of unknown function (DUF6496)